MNLRAVLVAATLAFSCGPHAPPTAPAPPRGVPIGRACDIAPAAGLSWLVELEPRAIASIPDLIPAIAEVVPEERFTAYAKSHGGVDPRTVPDLCMARYGEVRLSVAKTPIDPRRIERAFAELATRVDGRTIVSRDPPVIRLTGDVLGEPETVTLFAQNAVALEQGRGLRVMRAVEAFALGKLKQSRPALRGVALARAAALLGEAPFRFFVPAPFGDEASRGLAGLLRATTAVGVAARFVGPPARIAVRVVLLGAWEGDEAAADRFAAAANVLAQSAPGRLFGLNHPHEPVRVRTASDALILDAVLDGSALARGLRDAVSAEASDILSPWHPP